MSRKFIAALALSAFVMAGSARAAVKSEGLDKTGAPGLTSAGALAFGPDGVLFVADPAAATLYAIGVPVGEPQAVTSFKVAGIDAKIAEALGVKAADITIVDVATQPN